jgi:DNA modification methylase
VIADVLAGRRSWWVEQADVLDALRAMPSESVNCVCTSPPYFGLRDYGIAGQIGLEPTPAEYVATMVRVFAEVRRVLRKDGTLWLNLGDSYAGSWGAQSRPGYSDGSSTLEGGSTISARQIAAHPRLSGGTGSLKRTPGLKPKDLIGIPWRVAFALQEDGWYLRSAITWCKRACMPESVTDRPTSATEMVFLLTKAPRYWYDADAVKEPMAESSVGRLSQGTFKAQTGGPKDYGLTGDNARSARKALNNLHEKYIKHEKWKSRHEGWAECDPAMGRNLRNFWLLGPEPYPDAHFAVFPSEIPRRAILAGCPPKVCPACGAPWKRVTKVTYENPGNRTTNGPRSLAQRHETAGFPVRLEKAVETLGWEPGCKHGLDPIGGVVLDVFSGAGTTGVVALRLGRRFVGVELNPAYAGMARRRIESDCPLFNREELPA